MERAAQGAMKVHGVGRELREQGKFVTCLNLGLCILPSSGM
jgi:hypothetical protein